MNAFRTLRTDTRLPMEELYAEDVIFQDPIHRIEGRAALDLYHQRMNRRIHRADFEFGTPIREPHRAAVPWTMTVLMRPGATPIVVPGVSLLDFDELIKSHRDHFDLGAMVYEKLPLLGPLVRMIKNSF